MAETQNRTPLWRSIYRIIPLKVMLVLVIWCSVVQENYPFSHFPMYSKFLPSTYYVYLADKNGDSIPMLSLTGMLTSLLKKIHKHEERLHKKKIDKRISDFTWEDRREPGEAALRFVFANLSPEARKKLAPYRPLRLRYVHLARENAQIMETDRVIAHEELALQSDTQSKEGQP